MTTTAATTEAASLPVKTTPAPKPVVANPKPAVTTKPVVDVTPPHVSITKAPPAATAETAASVSFSSSEPGTTFACRLDGGAWQPCLSPRTLEGLALGNHTLAVRGTDKAGNAGQAHASWKVVLPPDTTPPTVSITSGPAATTIATSAAFTFTADEAGVSFTCSLDNAPSAACVSPAAYDGLAIGSHTFSVRATDAAGNAGSASQAWEITAPPLPDLLVSSLRNNGLTVKNAGTAASGATIVVVRGVGTFSIAALAPGQSFSLSWPCTAGTLTAIVDPSNTVAESNEGNNVTTRVTNCLGFGS